MQLANTIWMARTIIWNWVARDVCAVLAKGPMINSYSSISVVDGAVWPVGDVDLDALEAAELLEVVERPPERLRLRAAVLAAAEGVGHLEQPQLAQPRPRVPLQRLADPVVAVGVLQLAGVQRQRSAKENRSYIIGWRDF